MKSTKKMGMGGMNKMSSGSMMENSMYKSGGPVGKKPKMKIGGSCGTPKSLSKKK